MRQPERIAIAGAGIIGLACALLLKHRGLEVTVFEASEAVREASWAAGGMLAAEDPENPAALLPFSRYSRSLYPLFLEQIEALSGHRVALRTHQTVQIVDPARPASAGVPLSRDEAISLVPGLAESDHSYLLLEEASLDPRELCTALRSAVTVAGVALHEYEPVLSVEQEGEAVLLTTGRRMMHADAFVNCCGAWAASLHPAAAVAPSKGQVLVVTQPAGPGLTRVLRSPEVYLIPRRLPSTDDSRIVIGATVEDAGYSRQVDPAALALLRRRAAALWPPAADAPEVESWAGLRPATADGLPLIGLIEQAVRSHHALRTVSSARPELSRAKVAEMKLLSSRPEPSRVSETGVVEGSAVPDGEAPQFLAAGHHRNGILLAPGTAHVIADLVFGRTPAIDLAPFAPHRAAMACVGSI